MVRPAHARLLQLVALYHFILHAFSQEFVRYYFFDVVASCRWDAVVEALNVMRFHQLRVMAEVGHFLV